MTRAPLGTVVGRIIKMIDAYNEDEISRVTGYYGNYERAANEIAVEAGWSTVLEVLDELEARVSQKWVHQCGIGQIVLGEKHRNERSH